MKWLLIFLFFPIQLIAQDITGIWTGYITTTDVNLPYEIVISNTNGKLTGYSHTTFRPKGEDLVSVKKVKINKENDKVLIEDEDVIFDQFKIKPPKKYKQYSELVLLKEDSTFILSGKFHTNVVKYMPVGFGTIRLQKKPIEDSTKIIAKLKEMNLVGELSFLKPQIIEKEVVVIVPPKPEPEIPLPKKENGIEVTSISPKTKTSAITFPAKSKIISNIKPQEV